MREEQDLKQNRTKTHYVDSVYNLLSLRQQVNQASEAEALYIARLLVSQLSQTQYSLFHSSRCFVYDLAQETLRASSGDKRAANVIYVWVSYRMSNKKYMTACQ